METKLFHIFRNTPLGRETLLQSMYFCTMTRSSMVMYIPKHTKFLMYFEDNVVQVDLDGSYLLYPETAEKHAMDLAQSQGIETIVYEPRNYTASTLPDIPVNFDFMCCPRSISDLSTKISLGHIGTRVRKIIQCAQFPVLITSPSYKPWTRILVFFGGSANSIRAVNLGLRLARQTGMPIDMFTQATGNTSKEEYKQKLEKAGVAEECNKRVQNWMIFEDKDFEENLYHVPHDALTVMGAYGHGVVKDILVGSKMETIQSILSNNLLIAGPHYVSKV